MIIDRIENISFYKEIIPELKDIEKIILDYKKEFKVGKYDFEWGTVIGQEGVTKPLLDGDFETHKENIDIQILLEGEEFLVWNERGSLSGEQEYLKEKDVIYYKKGNYENIIKITPSLFYICFQNDGHKAVRHLKYPSKYKKIVVKVKLKEKR